MERRSAIKSLLVFAGGMAILPSYSIDFRRASIRLTKVDFTAEQEKILAEATETLIPETDTPGAKALGIHLFVMKMLDDCHEKNEQEKFVAGLNYLEKYCKQKLGKSFGQLNKHQRETLFKDVEEKKDFSDDTYLFYKILKERTILGYLNSKYVMTKLLVYELVPGRYNGYFPVKKD